MAALVLFMILFLCSVFRALSLMKITRVGFEHLIIHLSNFFTLPQSAAEILDGRAAALYEIYRRWWLN